MVFSNKCLATYFEVDHVSTATAFPKATLGIWKKVLCQHLQAVLDNSCEELANNLQETNTTPIVAATGEVRYQYSEFHRNDYHADKKRMSLSSATCALYNLLLLE